jgi:quercetin dioxygenase-like cupin family protein
MGTREQDAVLGNAAFHTPAPGRLIQWGVGPGNSADVYVLAEAAQTGRRCTVALHELAAEEESGLHVHTLEDEGFYVLEGEITFQMPDDGIEIHASAGEFVWHPMSRAHGFKTADKPVRLLQFLLPGTELVPGVFELTEGEKGARIDSPEKFAKFAETVDRDYGMRFGGPDGPPPSLRARSSQGPFTPDARLLMPPEIDTVVNSPFKSDPTTVHKLPQGPMYEPANLIFHAFGHQTGNVFGMLELIWTAPGMIGPHTHTLEDEYFYVVEGEFTLHLSTLDGVVTYVGKAGDWIWGPRDIPHYFTVGESARVISGEIPGGTMIEFFYGMAMGRGSDLTTEEKLAEFKEWSVKTSGMHDLAEGEWPGEVIPAPTSH